MPDVPDAGETWDADWVLRDLARKAGHKNPDGMTVPYLWGWLQAALAVQTHTAASGRKERP